MVMYMRVFPKLCGKTEFKDKFGTKNWNPYMWEGSQKVHEKCILWENHAWISTYFLQQIMKLFEFCFPQTWWSTVLCAAVSPILTIIIFNYYFQCILTLDLWEHSLGSLHEGAYAVRYEQARSEEYCFHTKNSGLLIKQTQD